MNTLALVLCKYFRVTLGLNAMPLDVPLKAEQFCRL